MLFQVYLIRTKVISRKILLFALEIKIYDIWSILWDYVQRIPVTYSNNHYLYILTSVQADAHSKLFRGWHDPFTAIYSHASGRQTHPRFNTYKVPKSYNV